MAVSTAGGARAVVGVASRILRAMSWSGGPGHVRAGGVEEAAADASEVSDRQDVRDGDVGPVDAACEGRRGNRHLGRDDGPGLVARRWPLPCLAPRLASSRRTRKRESEKGGRRPYLQSLSRPRSSSAVMVRLACRLKPWRVTASSTKGAAGSAGPSLSLVSSLELEVPVEGVRRVVRAHRADAAEAPDGVEHHRSSATSEDAAKERKKR